MALLLYPAGPVPSLCIIQGRALAIYSATAVGQLPGRTTDIRQVRSTTGSITDQVVVKAGAAEVPFVNGRVWLLRAADGFKAWEGWSDAAGYYTATGLEIGVEYVMLAIDSTGTHKTTGAGPVPAT